MRDLSGSSIGTTTTVRGYDHRFRTDFEVEAFNPAPLPPRVELSASSWSAITEAHEALGRLDASTQMISNPTLLTRLATRREAIGTSAIEGTFANLADVYAVDALDDEQAAALPQNLREVVNYTLVADAAYAWVADRPITIGLLASLQARLVDGTPAAQIDRGELRTQQVYIGVANRPISKARYVPPPPGDQLRGMLQQWVTWVEDRSVRPDVPLLAALAMAHYQFESIHPFHDGNGRLGRLVIVLQLLRAGVLTTPVLSLSTWLRNHDAEYRDHLLETSLTGDWNPFVSFLAGGIRDQAIDTQLRVRRLLDLRTELVDRVRTVIPRAALAREISEALISTPIISVASAAAKHGRSNQANRDAIAQLVNLGVLQPFSEQRYGRLYWNSDVFAIIS